MGITFIPMALNTLYTLVNTILKNMDLAIPLSSRLIYFIAYMILSLR